MQQKIRENKSMHKIVFFLEENNNNNKFIL